MSVEGLGRIGGDSKSRWRATPLLLAARSERGPAWGRVMRMNGVLACVALVTLHPIAVAEERDRAGKERHAVETVSFCDLVKSHATYDQKRVRSTATLLVNPEERMLLDPRCPGIENAVWVDRGQLDKAVAERKVRRTLRRLLRREGEARLTVIGTFFGPRRYDPPAGTPPDVASLLVRTKSRYGHLNSFRFRFEIEVIEESSPVPK